MLDGPMAATSDDPWAVHWAYQKVGRLEMKLVEWWELKRAEWTVWTRVDK